MAYCRFNDSSDVYMYYDFKGYIQCCFCLLAPREDTIFTKGKDNHWLFGKINPCEQCGGSGCSDCQAHTSQKFSTFSAAIEHLYEHRAAGHLVSSKALDRLEEDMKEEGENE